MLTSQSYVIAMAVYLGVAVLAIALMARFWFRRFPAALRRLLVGLLMGLLLTPALPAPDADTLAPALVVALFNTLFGEGWQSATPAVGLLLIASGGAALLALLSLWIPGLGPKSSPRRKDGQAAEPADTAHNPV